MVGFSSTLDTSGTENTPRTDSSRSAQTSTCPSPWASSKMARAYRLATVPATGASHFLYCFVDEATMPVAVQGLPHHLLGGRDDEVSDLGTHAVEGLVALGDDLLARILGDPPGLLLGTPSRVGAQLLSRPVGALDDGGRLAPRLPQLSFRVLEAPLR